jgi:hypothetical protein
MKIGKKSGDLHTRISPEAKEKLDKICQQEHRSQGAQIEYWISQYDLHDDRIKGSV